MNIMLFILIGLLVAGIAVLAYAYYKLKNQYSSLSTAFHSNAADLGALCSSALIQDKRIFALEQKLLESVVSGDEKSIVAPRMEMDLDNSEDDFPEPDEHVYQAAIKGIRQGVNAQQLVDDWGMSKDEADLLVRLHGKS
ncbi:MAG: DUF2802 domain-containing protein [Methylococcales bacterium]